MVLALNFTSGEKQIERHIVHAYDVHDPQFLRAMGTLLGPPMLAGNRVQTLRNGDEIFPSMLEAIASAQRTIDFETYIYWEGEIGQRFADALSERARAGVKVHVLLDWVGSERIEESLVKGMEDAAVAVRRYHPLRWYNLGRLNNRTHRKLLVVDGRIGFTGGVGIATQWTGHAQDKEHWRDTHFRAEGPVVAQMQAVFLDNWIKISGEVLHTEPYFPAIAPAGEVRAQMFSSSPAAGSESMQLMYLLAIAASSRSIRMSASYFVPDDLSIRTLVEARHRGVSVDVIVPGEKIDAALVRNASRARWGALLEAGVRIYEYQPTMYHCKVMVVDGMMVSLGSTNFDPRSFRLNDEANLNVYDAGFAAEQERIFAADLAQSREITLEQWQDRPVLEKIREHAASLLRSQL